MKIFYGLYINSANLIYLKAKAYFFLFFIMLNLNLASQELINPVNNYCTLNPIVSFQWEDYQINSDSFKIEVATDSLFTNIVIASSVGVNNINLVIDSFNQKLFWRVVFFNSTISVSEFSSFVLMDPLSIPSIKLWINPDQNTFISGVNSLDSIRSISSNFVLSQLDSTKRPKMEFNINPAYSTIEFDGIDDFLSSGNVLNMDSSSFTVYFVLKKHTEDGTVIDKRGTGNIYYTAGYQFMFSGINNNSYISDGNLTYKRIINQNYFGSDSLINLYKFTWNNSTGLFSLYKNNIFIATSTGFGNLSNKNINSNVDFKIGARSNSVGTVFSNFLEGEIAELIIVKDISDSLLLKNIDNYLFNKFTPKIQINNIIMNNFCDTVLDVGIEYIKDYLWSNGSDSSIVVISEPGKYWLQTTSFFNQVHTDTFTVLYPNDFNLPNDTVLCLGDILVWNMGFNSNNFSFMWNTASIDSFISIIDAGEYYCKITDENACSFDSDTLNVIVDSFSIINYNIYDTSVCENSQFTILPFNSSTDSIFWSSGDTSNSINLTSSGLYSVFMENINNCVYKDSFNVNIKGISPNIYFIIDTVCFKDSTSFIELSTTLSPDNISFSSWVINDHDTITDFDFKYLFDSAGTFNINHYIETDSGCFNSSNSVAIVNPLPHAKFVNPIVCKGINYQIFDLSLDSVINRNWYLNNSIMSHDSLVQINFTYIGINTLTLSISDSNGCIDSITKQIEVFPPLTPNFSTTNLCLGDSTAFLDQTESLSIVDRNWTFDGLFNSSLANPKHLFSSIGIHPVSLTVENAIGCINTISKNINILPQPITSFKFDKTCLNTNSLFYDNSMVSDSIISYSWQIDNTIYNTDSINHIFLEEEDYDILLEIETENACKGDTLQTIKVNPVPNPNFSFSPNYGTAPLEVEFTNQTQDATNYIWNFDSDTSFSNEENPSFTFSENGIYNITLLAINQFNCEAEISQQISIIPSDLDIELKKLDFEIIKNSNNTISIKPSVWLSNVGTRKIKNTDLVLRLNNSSQFAQKWEGSLEIGEIIDYTFDSYFIVSSKELSNYVCVEAINVNDNTEENLTNNKTCKIINGLIQFSLPYPNPADNNIFLDVVTKEKGKCSIEIVDMLGNLVFPKHDIQLLEAYNKLQIKTAKYQSGKYLIKFIYLDELYVKNFIVK